MKPIELFTAAWSRCGHLTGLHTYLASKLTIALNPDELLRAEWVARVSALDLYIHELITQRLLEIYTGKRNPSAGFKKFQTGNNTVLKLINGESQTSIESALELEIRTRLGFISYQDPDKIADGIRLFSDIELWNEIALLNGATQQTKTTQARKIKKDLSLIIDRRNKIAHEGDFQPTIPRDQWPIDTKDLVTVRDLIIRIVKSIDELTI